MRALDAEVLVLGAGPAGATVALNLAPHRKTVIADRRSVVGGRVVESLPPVGGRVLADMGLFDAFLAQGHGRWQVKRSMWEGPEPVEVDLLRDPDGFGWHLDRPMFAAWLRSVAIERGATLVSPAEVVGVEEGARRGWRVSLSTPDGPLVVRASTVVDAAGRTAPLASRLGARRVRHDRLACGWVAGTDRDEAGSRARRAITFIEAVRDGWWYTAATANGARLVAFHTDGDLPASNVARDGERVMVAALAETDHIRQVLADVGFEPGPASGWTTAHSAVLEPSTGAGWQAVGDAALSFDPVSSQGLLTALATGLAGAAGVERHLRGDAQPFAELSDLTSSLATAYRHNLRSCYGAVKRWPDSTFWARRNG